MIHDPALHHQFVLLFEIKNASPLNLSPLESPFALAQEVRYGLVKGEALKRKIGRYAQQHGLPLLCRRQTTAQDLEQSKNTLCKLYYDARMFGIATREQKIIPGPVRFSWARSLDPVLPLASGKNAAYGLYRGHGRYDPHLGQHTGVRAPDLALLWQALRNLFQTSPALYPMESSVRGLWIFSHHTAQTKDVLKLVQTPALGGLAQQFEDYALRFPNPGQLEALPGVTLTLL